MKKMIIASLFVIMTGSQLSAVSMRMDTPNVVSLELLGKCGAFSFCYDRNLDFFGDVGKFLGVGAGIFYGVNSGLFNLPFYANFYLGNDSAAFVVQGGGKLGNFDVDSKVGVRPYVGIGFETRKPFVFRLLVYYNYVNIGDGQLEGWIPWPGLTFGFAF